MLAKIDQRRQQDVSEKLRNLGGWYHSFRLPDGQAIEGVVPLSTLQDRWAEFNLPENLSGKAVLDIGAWDGWFTFEAARRGARVTAVDNWENPKLRWLQKQFGLSVEYVISDLYALPERKLEPFDYVFFLGVLYHIRHPLLGLEIVASLTKEAAFIDSFVVEEDGNRSELPYLEFYETDELGNHLDNWFGPTIPCLEAMCRAAGFVRVRKLSLRNSHATLVAHRQWDGGKISDSAGEGPDLGGVQRTSDHGANFDSNKDQYLACYFTSTVRPANRHELYFCIGPFAAETLKVTLRDGYYLANLRLPPGLSAGWWDVRFRIRNGPWSNSVRIAVDIPIRVESLRITGCRDAMNGGDHQVERASGALSIWMLGLAENADIGNIRVSLGDHSLAVIFVAPGGPSDNRQVNATLPDDIPSGTYTLLARHGSAESRADNIHVV